jgi:hypothetical protein
MSLRTIERLSPFSSSFTWDDYTSELYCLSDDAGFLTVDQMNEELKRFQMPEHKITFSMTVDEFVDFLFDAHS